MNREIVPKVKMILNDANTEAKSNSENQIKPEHILIAILNDENNIVVKAFKTLNVDVNKLSDKLNEYIRGNNLSSNVTTKRIRLPFSDDAKKIMNQLDSISESLNDTSIEIEHVLLSMLKNNKLNVTNLLKEYDVTFGVMVIAITELKGNEKRNNKTSNMMNEEPEDGFGGDLDSPKRNKKAKSSKTPVLDNFCTDITKLALEGKIDPIIGREQVIKRTSQVLSRRRKHNPVLVGDAGVGKSAIIEGLAQMIVNGKAPRTLLNKKIMSLDLTSMVAGTKYRGQFEERMKAILDELKDNDDIILFIDELHTMVGAGNSSGSLDASNILKPALARGEIQIIGATTIDEFREHIEKDGALTRRFQQVLIEEPTPEETIVMLKNIKIKYEDYHKVTYTDEAIEECVKLSHRYITDRALPDKAIDVLDEAGASTNIEIEIPEKIKTLEVKKNDIQNKKIEVVKMQKYEEAAKLRDDERKLDSELAKAKEDWNNSLDKKRTTVNVDMISDVISTMTGIPVNKISNQENKHLIDMEKELLKKVIGQDDAVSKVSRVIKRSRLGIKDKNKPTSLVFLGSSGTGKCVCGDTTISVRNKTTGEIMNVTISEFKKLI
jgi:ATP-dependent Clp protease ATP-binding subunit ClpC